MNVNVDSKIALITGTTSNLGINIAYRLLEKIPASDHLTLIVTSRTLPKAKQVIETINNHFIKYHGDRIGKLEFDYILVDFSDMVSVLSTFYELNKKYSRIDYLFINAAQGVYSGINWPQAFVEIFKNPVEGVTNPTYKTQRVGVKSSDGLGLVFQANVFGPFYLVHKCKDLLKGGKVIWISSIMANPKYLSFLDLQLLRSPEPYEGSKRLVDLLHIGTYKKFNAQYGIKEYVVHPGIFTSFSFFQFLNFFTYYGMILLFYIARLLGSRYHNISGYTAANAPISCAFNDEDQSYKICSQSDRLGREYLAREEIDATGAEDVVHYFEELCKEWDDKLKNQIVSTRQP
ncbi:uncharacterized protein PRCAT00006225001 [Priceomyces carsonii]|uniref:uncharacterized protein n=1 Tax=Priceomyces carsonii TaxID=28549 RepID=UPI002ED7EEF4|nr:unnamed protein product [Priceomyces carsonii]